MNRRLLIVTVFLLAGAVLNVAVYEGGWGHAQIMPGDKIVVRLPSDLFVAKMMVIELGWPLHTLVTQHRTETYHYPPLYSEQSTGWINAFMTPDPMRYIRLHARSAYPFPYQPLWPGFAVNTLFYAALLWLLICGPLAMRRFIRIRRGLCPACAYPRGESAVCTECGRELPKRAGVVAT